MSTAKADGLTCVVYNMHVIPRALLMSKRSLVNVVNSSVC